VDNIGYLTKDNIKHGADPTKARRLAKKEANPIGFIYGEWGALFDFPILFFGITITLIVVSIKLLFL
jgi:hypothetical protein